jgi:hypothetical protein
MKRFAILIAITAVAALAVPAIGIAQAPTDMTKPMTGMKPDRTTADAETRKAMREKEAAMKKKRADCRAKAKAEKVSLFKRPAYVKECMAQ